MGKGCAAANGLFSLAYLQAISQNSDIVIPLSERDAWRLIKTVKDPEAVRAS
jgi:hypothetical protein